MPYKQLISFLKIQCSWHAHWHTMLIFQPHKDHISIMINFLESDLIRGFWKVLIFLSIADSVPNNNYNVAIINITYLTPQSVKRKTRNKRCTLHSSILVPLLIIPNQITIKSRLQKMIMLKSPFKKLNKIMIIRSFLPKIILQSKY